MEWLTNIWNSFVETYWKPHQFLPSLQYMWQGMLCIFVVIAVIILSVYIMNFCSERAAVMKQIKDEEKEDNK